MTEQEKQEIIEEIKKSMIFIADDSKTVDVQMVLNAPRKKWFTNGIGKGKKDSPMYELLGGKHSYGAWECIRKLTCHICKESYVRDLQGNEKATEIAERICQLVYELSKEYSEESENEK